MGTISNARAVYALSASGAATGTNVSGSATVGASQSSVSMTDADICYSFRVESTGSDTATLTLSSGVVAQTTGTPTITDGDGKDFEGATLPTMTGLYAVLINCETLVSSNTMTYSAMSSGADCQLAEGKILQLWDTAISPTGTLAWSMGASGNIFTVTILGKSS